jgi:lipid-binding SYLF domain-containing protein
MRIQAGSKNLTLSLCIALALAFFTVEAQAAKTKREIDAGVKAALGQFLKDVKGAPEFLKAAKGVLIMPQITKAGLVVGGQFGSGALQIGGKNVEYYSLAGASFGFQAGAEQYDMVILFMTDASLKKFRNSKGWEAGVDAEVTLVAAGADLTVETLRSQSPVVGFVYDQKGLMGGVSVKGAKFTKTKPK